MHHIFTNLWINFEAILRPFWSSKVAKNRVQQVTKKGSSFVGAEFCFEIERNLAKYLGPPPPKTNSSLWASGGVWGGKESDTPWVGRHTLRINRKYTKHRLTNIKHRLQIDQTPIKDNLKTN